jgi:hypothetical protein
MPAGKNWSRPLPRPIVIPDLKLTLRTLADIRALISRVPRERRETRTWRHVAKGLLPPFLAVHFRVLPCGMVLVLGGLQVMTECNPGVMSGFLVVARLVMLGGLAMMLGGVFVVLCRLFVMFVNLDLSHFVLPDIGWK